MIEETSIWYKEINGIVYTKTAVTTFKDSKLIRYEITYSPRIKFGLELNNWILQN